ncbi:cytochrome c maturation protein CcmE [Paracoccus sp. WLY502]|uniref:cytochrome c maturation protein CcmE n=1 Tax=Paracoccus yibinensis TaxID=3068891 RepID=UPI0027967823|nr:cytochrome c maturation protein CcmE [Paracoccus sp. WLY502]MDQ1899996.1 cytochrome c maturation protein CcmE [Paracoccus sp. WLY502]
MKSLKKRRRIQVIVAAAVALLIAAGLIGYGFRDGINLYRSPTQVAEAAPEPDEYFQLGGLVKDGSIVNRDGVQFDFVITDGAAEIPVSYVGRDPRPDLFTEGQGTIAKGYYRDGRFEARDLLAKHDETYMPREVMDTLKETGVYQDPNS